MPRRNDHVVLFWARERKCPLCEAEFSQPVLLPARNLRPQMSAEAVFHLSATHGLPPDTVRGEMLRAVYA